MEEITLRRAELPDTIEELSQFVFIGREKLTALKAAIKACRKSEVIADKLHQMKEEEQLLAENVLIAEMRIGELLEEVPRAKGNQYMPTPTDGVGQKAKNLGITHPERYQILAKHPQEVEQAINAEMRIGELLKEVPKEQGKRTELSNSGVTKLQENLSNLGINKMTASRYQVLANHQDLVEEAIEEAKTVGRAVTRQDVINKVSHNILHLIQYSNFENKDSIENLGY